jgi:hypothetical protein
MGIERGAEWGCAGQLSAQDPVVDSDAAAAGFVRLDDTASPVTVGIQAGDLARTLGVRPPVRPGPKHLVPVDAIVVSLDDGPELTAVANVVVGQLRLGSEVVALMNAAFVADRNLAPRAHPGDGLVDEVSLRLPVSDRRQAWTRMATGTHVPHPGIKIRRRSEGVVELTKSRRVKVDGVAVGKARTLRYRLVPQALVVAV